MTGDAETLVPPLKIHVVYIERAHRHICCKPGSTNRPKT
jgi:hypothetical protein